MNKIKERHIFIIWSNARNKEDEIKRDISSKFEVIQIVSLTWSKSEFQNNLSRFYGKKLPSLKSKMKHCGNGEFLLVIVDDVSPRYEWRKTSSGKAYVNVNMFDAKALYREWTSGGHKIHATNDTKEVQHDLTLLMGKNAVDYVPKSRHIKLKQDLVGARGWDNLADLFYVLNNTAKYVIMRNFEGYPHLIVSSCHDDIDFLTIDEEEFARLLCAKKKHSTYYRAQYEFDILGKKYICDIRDIKSDYYPKAWSEKILNNSILWNDINIPNKINYGYSLLYHAIYHKISFSNEYQERVSKLLELGDMSKEKMHDQLNQFMINDNYVVSEPTDYSVFLNRRYGDNVTKLRKFYDVFRTVELYLYDFKRKYCG